MSKRRARARRSPNVGSAIVRCPSCGTRRVMDAADAVDSAPACPECDTPMLTVHLKATLPIRRRPKSSTNRRE